MLRPQETNSTKAKRILKVTQKKIIEAAVVTLASHPAATLSEIAAKAGVDRMTIHRHFGSRETLLAQIAVHALEEMREAAQQAFTDDATAKENLVRSIESIMPIADRVQFLLRNEALWEDPKLIRKLKKLNRDTTSIINACKDEGEIDSAIPTAWVIEAIDGLVMSALKAKQDGHISADEMALFVIRTLFGGIQPIK